MENLNKPVTHLKIIDMYRTKHIVTAEYKCFFPWAHGTFTNIDHILGYRKI